MYYKKFINEKSKYIKIDDKHSCTEEQLRAFMVFLFQNYREMFTLHEIFNKKKSQHEPGLSQSALNMHFLFDEAINKEFNVQEANYTSALYRNIFEFMNDTLSE